MKHLGTVRLAPTDDGVRLTWEIRISSRWPFVCWVVGHGLRRGLPAAPAYFKADVEASHAAAAER